MGLSTSTAGRWRDAVTQARLVPPMADRPQLIRFPFRRQHSPRRVGSVTALDVDGPMLRLAQASLRGNRPAVTRAAFAPLEIEPGADRADPVALGKAIGRTLGTLKIRPGSTVM